MRVFEHKDNMVILSHGKNYYLISYNTVIAKVCNTINLGDVNNDKEYGLFLSHDWDYSQTTLKHLYKFITSFATQRDERGMTFGYQLDNVPNKKEYIKKQIELGNIKVIENFEM